MSDIAFSSLEQQVMNCTYDEKLNLLSFIADLLKSNPKQEKKVNRTLGGLKGQIWMAEDFDETPDCFKEYI